MSDATLRPAAPGDISALTRMVHELAAFEHAAELCVVTDDQLRRALFGGGASPGDGPTGVRATVAEVDGEVAAFALCYPTFSTWEGVAGLHLEDLFVGPRFRRRGLARALLASLAADCVREGLTRLEWSVLTWNVDAVALYEAVGAQAQREWLAYRLSGPALAALAGAPSSPSR